MKQPHILCRKEDVAPRVLLPGDPARVLRVAEMMDEVREVAYNREFRTITGNYRDTPITVTSTGIGGASAAIALEELIACGGRAFIRIGSAGACQPEIGIGDLILPQAAVREDGASRMYAPDSYPAAADFQLLSLLEYHCRKAGYPFHVGLGRSHDSFYVDDEQERMAYWNRCGVLGSDMETALLFTVGRLRGVSCAAVLNNVVLFQGDVKDGISDYVSEEDAAAAGEEREITAALEALKDWS